MAQLKVQCVLCVGGWSWSIWKFRPQQRNLEEGKLKLRDRPWLPGVERLVSSVDCRQQSAREEESQHRTSKSAFSLEDTLFSRLGSGSKAELPVFSAPSAECVPCLNAGAGP